VPYQRCSFFVGAIVLVLSPATVSAEVSAAELGVLAVGPVLIMMLNPALRTRVWRRWTS
jgi:hypothetical protein